MKGILALLFFLIIYAPVQSLFGQTFTIYVADSSMISESEENGFQFTPIDSNIQYIISNYQIYHIEKAFPASRFSYMSNLFTFKVDSIQLLGDLLTYNDELFPLRI